jgi:hypothetical protein
LSLKREERQKKEGGGVRPKPADVPENNVVESCKTQTAKIVKKRGRKPKGGKIILKPELNEPSQ